MGRLSPWTGAFGLFFVLKGDADGPLARRRGGRYGSCADEGPAFLPGREGLPNRVRALVIQASWQDRWSSLRVERNQARRPGV